MDHHALVGIASNATTHVDVEDASGDSHPVPLSPAKTFIYFSPGACACTVSAIISTGALTSEHRRPP